MYNRSSIVIAFIAFTIESWMGSPKKEASALILPEIYIYAMTYAAQKKI